MAFLKEEKKAVSFSFVERKSYAFLSGSISCILTSSKDKTFTKIFKSKKGNIAKVISEWLDLGSKCAD